jgi:hypothetical protein
MLSVPRAMPPSLDVSNVVMVPPVLSVMNPKDSLPIWVNARPVISSTSLDVPLVKELSQLIMSLVLLARQDFSETIPLLIAHHVLITQPLINLVLSVLILHLLLPVAMETHQCVPSIVRTKEPP